MGKIDNYDRSVAVLQRISKTLRNISLEINRECNKDIIDPRVLVSIGISMQNLLGGLSQIIPVITNRVIELSVGSSEGSSIGFNDKNVDSLKNMVNNIFNKENLDFESSTEENEDDGNLMDGLFNDDQDEDDPFKDDQNP